MLPCAAQGRKSGVGGSFGAVCGCARDEGGMYGGGGARVPLGSPAIFPGAPPRRAAAGGGGGETAVCAAGCTILCGCGGVLVKSVATSSMRRLQGGRPRPRPHQHRCQICFVHSTTLDDVTVQGFCGCLTWV